MQGLVGLAEDQTCVVNRGSDLCSRMIAGSRKEKN